MYMMIMSMSACNIVHYASSVSNDQESEVSDNKDQRSEAIDSNDRQREAIDSND